MRRLRTAVIAVLPISRKACGGPEGNREQWTAILPRTGKDDHSGVTLDTIRQMAEERRNRKESALPTRLGEQWGKCVGVHETGRDSRSRKVVRVLLASGFVVTAYLAANTPVPAVDANVLVASAQCRDQPAGGGECRLADPGPGDLPGAGRVAGLDYQ